MSSSPEPESEQLHTNEFEGPSFFIEDHDEKWACDEEPDCPGVVQDNDMSSCSENGSPNSQLDRPQLQTNEFDGPPFFIGDPDEDWASDEEPDCTGAVQDNDMSSCPEHGSPNAHRPIRRFIRDDNDDAELARIIKDFPQESCKLPKLKQSLQAEHEKIQQQQHQYQQQLQQLQQHPPPRFGETHLGTAPQRFTDDVCRLESPSKPAAIAPTEWHQQVSHQLAPRQVEKTSVTAVSQRLTDKVCRLDSPSASPTIMTPKQMEASSFTTVSQRYTDEVCRMQSSTSASIMPTEWQQPSPPMQEENSSFTSVAQRYTDEVCRMGSPSTSTTIMPTEWHHQASPQLTPRQVEKSSFTIVPQRLTDEINCRRESPSKSGAIVPAEWHQQISSQLTPRQVEKSSFTTVTKHFTDDTCRREPPSTSAAIVPADWHQQAATQLPQRQVEKSSFTAVSQRFTDEVCRRETPLTSGAIVPADRQNQHVAPQPGPPLSPSRPKSPWGMLDPYASSEKDCKEYVGFATLPNQVHRKSVKRGFEFTILVAGESGLGKSTLVNSLFLTDLYKDRVVLNAEDRIAQTVDIVKHTVDIEEKGVKLRLTVVDTPGFGDALNNTDSWKVVADYVEQQCEQYFRDESGLDRRNIQDNRVHCCLYFISPFGHGLRPLDIEFMRALHEKVNIVPVLAKADALTPTEVERRKKKIREEICEHSLRIYQFPDCDSEEDEEFKVQDDELKKSIPFAVIGSNTVVEANGKRVRGRLYPWGIVEVENPCHCDFLKLRTMLVKTHMQDLKDVTKECHYENYRSQCIQNMTRMVVKERNRNKLTRESGTDFPLPVAATAADPDTEQMIREKNQELQRMQEMLQKISCQMKMDLP